MLVFRCSIWLYHYIMINEELKHPLPPPPPPPPHPPSHIHTLTHLKKIMLGTVPKTNHSQYKWCFMLCYQNIHQILNFLAIYIISKSCPGIFAQFRPWLQWCPMLVSPSSCSACFMDPLPWLYELIPPGCGSNNDVIPALSVFQVTWRARHINFREFVNSLILFPWWQIRLHDLWC